MTGAPLSASGGSRAHGASVSRMRPFARRAAIGAISTLVHGGVFVLLCAAAPAVSVNREITIEVVSHGDGLIDATAATAATAPLSAVTADDPRPDETVDTPLPIETPVVKAAQAPAEPPPILTPPTEAADALDIAAQAAPMPRPEPRENVKSKKPRRTARRSATRSAAAASQGSDAVSSDARRAGSPTAQPGDLRAARASYGALISAELNRHKYYPAEARERGERGSVGAVFTVGPSGSIVSHSITRSSGSEALDGVVHAMMADARGLPPPGGSFRGNIVVTFSLR